MARGPDGAGGGAGFSLADQLFNADSLQDLADEFSALPGFDGARFHAAALGGLASRGLLERLDWIADCLEPRLAPDFPTMADQLVAALPLPLDPALRWTINQEIRARNLFKDDIPGAEIPKDWKRYTDDQLERLAKDPDSEIHDWGRWQPTPEEADELLRTEIYTREKYVKH